MTIGSWSLEGIFRQPNDSGDQSTSLIALAAHSTGINHISRIPNHCRSRHIQNIFSLKPKQQTVGQATSKSASLSFCASTLSPRIFSFFRSRPSMSIAPMSKTAIPPLSLTPMSRSDGREYSGCIGKMRRPLPLDC